MTSNRLPLILGLLAVVLIALYSSVFVVNAREQAIVVRFGQIQSVKTEPGIYFKFKSRAGPDSGRSRTLRLTSDGQE